jgi:hypothetical protein
MKNEGDEPGGDSCAELMAELRPEHDVIFRLLWLTLKVPVMPSLGRLAQSWGAQTQQ